MAKAGSFAERHTPIHAKNQPGPLDQTLCTSRDNPMGPAVS
jgi:hypothetical protein